MSSFSLTALLRWSLKSADTAGGRLAGLDGVRGLAMLMVIFCHLRLIGGAWLGLSSFFVLSGFLITKILISDKRASVSYGEYYKRFYIRRVLRVFPIYYAYLLALLVATQLIPQLAKLEGDLPYAFMYVYNLYMSLSHDQHHTRMLTHLWSLSLEEQFYLIWPFVVALSSRRGLLALSVLLVLLGPVIRWGLGTFVYPDVVSGTQLTVQQVTYVMTPTHLDAFAIRALMNFVDVKKAARFFWPVLAFAVLIGVAVNGLGIMPQQNRGMFLHLGWPLWMHDGGQWIWGYTIVNMVWFLLMCSILAGTRVRRFFSINLLDFLGKRSYSTYVIHYPLLGLTYSYWMHSIDIWGRLPGTLLFAVPYLALVFLVSEITYRCIELPMLNLKERFGQRDQKGHAATTAALERES